MPAWPRDLNKGGRRTIPGRGRGIAPAEATAS
jgi:hypothetical protein